MSALSSAKFLSALALTIFVKVWITTVGTRPFAVINPIWLACRKGEFVPERVYLIWNEGVEREKEVVEKAVRLILESYGVRNPEIIAGDETKVREDDFSGLRDLLYKIKGLEQGNEVAVDMTPGRKFMSALLMGVGFNKEGPVEKVYYLHLLDERRYQNRPLLLIPAKIQRLYEMRGELRGAAEKERAPGPD